MVGGDQDRARRGGQRLRLLGQIRDDDQRPAVDHQPPLLLVELDGPEAEVAAQMLETTAICTKNGAWEIRLAQTAAERGLIWKGRKAAFAAMGRVSPNYIVQDGVIPRTALPQVMSEISRLSAAAGIRVANVFHAGDGNLHPLVLYDARIPGQQHAAESLSAKILDLCIAAGGSCSPCISMPRSKFGPTRSRIAFTFSTKPSM